MDFIVLVQKLWINIKKCIGKDPVFERCFQQILFKEISVDVCISILRIIKDLCAS
jgi:ATP-dependent Clp protease ATP-binding subunit ClpA